jgi:hypothetical protein
MFRSVSLVMLISIGSALMPVEILGLSKLVRDLQALGVEVDELKDAFGSIAAEGARLAASFAPKRSGALAASVRGNRAKAKAVVSAGRARVKYAGVQNYGWPAHNIAATNFMQRADEALRPTVVPTLEKSIEAMIARKGLQ